MLRWLTLLIVLLSAPAALAQAPAAPVRAASPGGVIGVEITVDGDGRPSYAVDPDGPAGDRALAPRLPAGGRTQAGAELRGRQPVHRSFDQTWEQPWGERRFVRNRYNELRARLTEKSGARRSFDVVFDSTTTAWAFATSSPSKPRSRKC
jgi:alpha-glucosidase